VLDHLGVEVESTAEVAAATTRLSAAGMVTTVENDTTCCYALQDKTWVRDPDGNEWEAFVVLEDNLPEASACCNTEQTTATQKQPAASVCCGADQTTAVQISARN